MSSSSINSWCGRFSISTFILIISIFIFDYKANILPIKGIWLGLYMLIVIILTVWCSCILIQKLLKQNQAFEFDFERKQYLKLLKNACRTLHLPINFDLIATKSISEEGSNTPKIKKVIDVIDAIPILKRKVNVEPAKNIDDRIEQFAKDVEKRFVVKWYAYISENKNFLSENKILLEAVTRRVLQVSINVDSDKILCGCLVILLKHLKEYRKAVKRAKKNGNSVEAVYRYAHIGNKSDAAFEHYIHRLTENVLQEFINWELWNSLPCRLLVSILARRLTAYCIRYMSQPGIINYRLVSLFASEKISTQLELPMFAYISLFNIDAFNERIKKDKESVKIEKKKKLEGATPQISPKKEKILFNENGELTKIDSVIQPDSDSMIEKALTKMITQQTAPILQRAEKHQADENATPPISYKNTPEHKKPEFSPKRSEPVKIHSAKSTSKHWDDSDVGTVSVGQDLLALDSIENPELECFSGRRLWGPSIGNEFIEKNSHPLWDINEIFKDKDSIEGDDKLILKDESKMSPKLKDKNKGNVTASTLHNMRELQQSTVNNVVKPVSNATEKAIHKIGDLQDEAVGVVEGIFDFGMAGIRKGLRLTGLQDSLDSSAKTKQQTHPTQLQHQKSIEQSPKNVPKLVKVGHITSEDIKKSSQSSADSIDSSIWINPIAKDSPNGFENQMLFEKSPNIEQPPEKVVSVPSVPNIATESDNIFLTESPEYEETADLASTISKLRNLLQQKSSESSLNTPAASPMPVEMNEKTCGTPTEQTVPDAIRTDGGIQKFARTVTGMFNTFKGALPGNIEPVPAKNDQWIFVENEASNTDLSSLLNSLLIERRDYCTVDTAYEAMDTFDLMTESTTSTNKKLLWDNQTFEDEFDDFDTTIPITKALLDVLCECLLDTNCALKQEPVMRSILVLTGKKLESILSAFAFKMLRLLNKAVGPLPKNENDIPMTMDIEKMVRIIEEAFPNSIKNIFGENDIKIAVKFFVSSLQNQKINQDIILQLVELICSQFIFASSQMSPTPSA